MNRLAKIDLPKIGEIKMKKISKAEDTKNKRYQKLQTSLNN